MKLPIRKFAFAAASLPFLYPSLTAASDPPSADTTLPVQHLLDSANVLLAAGDMYGALDKLDAAIKKDPQDYLTFFKRGATYLSLGRLSQANADFDTVLTLRPDFESALLQRAKIKTKIGDWKAARRDYENVGGKTEEIAELAVAEKASKEVVKAEKRKDWESCVENAGVVLQLAPQLAELRAQRARCRLARGDTLEGISDLKQLAVLDPTLTDPHIHVSSLYFYALGEPDPAREQLRHCLTFDQDNKACKTHLRKIRTMAKSIEKVKSLQEKKLHSSAIKLLVGSDGLLDQARSEIKTLISTGYLTPSAGSGLLTTLLTLTCDSYVSINSHRAATPYCDELFTLSPTSLPAVLNKAKRLIEREEYDQAKILLEKTREHHPHDQRLLNLSREAQMLLQRSKSKDYYKVLGVPRDASEKEIKKAYRRLAREWHPDTYEGDLGKEEVEKKYAQIGEAWEVLGNEELRARFDRGDDPNDQTQQNPFAQGGHPFGGGFHGFPGGGQQFHFTQGGGPFGNGGGFKFHF
ncbi:hypothetical protein EV426DRAFT_600827 [Tirmania nivea]|nr:hypothetical protein EV426DRAFT_600827 [Tirmania nivea]